MKQQLFAAFNSKQTSHNNYSVQNHLTSSQLGTMTEACDHMGNEFADGHVLHSAWKTFHPCWLKAWVCSTKWSLGWDCLVNNCFQVWRRTLEPLWVNQLINLKTKQMAHFKHLVSIHCPCSCYTEVILHIESPYCVAFVTLSWFSCFYPQVLSPERSFLNTLTKNSVAEPRITVWPWLPVVGLYSGLDCVWNRKNAASLSSVCLFLSPHHRRGSADSN